MTFFFRFRCKDFWLHARLVSGGENSLIMGKVASGSALDGDAGMGDNRGTASDTGEDVLRCC